MLPANSANQQKPGPNAKDDDSGTQIRLFQNECGRDGEIDERFGEHAHPRNTDVASGKEIGEKDYQRQLGELGGLEIYRPEHQPASRLPNSRSEKEGGDQKKNGKKINTEDNPAIIKKWPPIYEGANLHHQKSDQKPDELGPE